MRILERAVYVGPSLYAHFPVIRLVVDLEALADWSSARLGEEFVTGVLAALPGLGGHGDGHEGRGDLAQRMRAGDGVGLGEILAAAAVELQRIAGEDLTFFRSRTIAGASPPLHEVIYAYAQREEGLAAAALALKLLAGQVPEALRGSEPVAADWQWDTARIDFIRYAQRRAFGPSTAALVKAAEMRGIPWLRLNAQSLIQFGHGRYQQRIQATITGRTSHIAVQLASDKEETNTLLAGLGLPVPRQVLVTNAQGAVRAARQLGGAVVTKPYNGNHGRGISIDLHTPEEIIAGFEAARLHSRSVIVETFIAGDDHRLLVVNGELIAATRRTPGHVVGDGVADIAELVDRINADPRRGIGHEKVLTQLELDEQADLMLERLGYHHFTVPAAGADARAVCYVTTNPSHALVRAHIRAGGRACALEAGVNGQMITLYDGGRHIPLMWTHLIPATLEGRATHNVSNAMFAASLAHALGLKLDAIRQGLRTFDTTFFQAPGRMNLFSEHPFKVLMDYAHNAHAASAIADLAGRMDVSGRRIVVLTGPGDRRDADLVEIARAVAGRFDHYIVRRDDALRGRGPEEVPRILAEALRGAGVPAQAIEVIPDEQQAVDAALRLGRAGDLVVVFADALARTWKQITKFRPAGAPEAHHTAAVGRDPTHDAGLEPEALPDGVVRDARGLVFARPPGADG